MMKVSCLCLMLSLSWIDVLGQVVFENELFKPEEVFDFEYSTDSDVYWTNQNVSKYYCIFRSLWTEENQPEKYPVSARWGDQIIHSGTKQFTPWLKNRVTTLGVEKVAESGFVDTFEKEAVYAGKVIKDIQQSDAFTINQDDWEKNYRYMPGIEFNADYNFISGIAGMVPSPCWFTGFYLFDVIDEYDRTFWERFRIKTYPWNAGTDAGDTYNSPDNDLDPPEVVHRMTNSNTPNGLFVGPDGKVGPVAEWDCVLHVCDFENPDCEPENWPPANYCDKLKYPGCESQCDPEVEQCQECAPKPEDEPPVYYKSCCESNYLPAEGGDCTYDSQLQSGGDGTAADAAGAGASAATTHSGVTMAVVVILLSSVACRWW
jgi:hypothetical protein